MRDWTLATRRIQQNQLNPMTLFRYKVGKMMDMVSELQIYLERVQLREATTCMVHNIDVTDSDPVCVCSCRMDLSSRLALWQELAESCGLSTVQQGLEQVWRLLLLCLMCRLCFRLGESHD